MTSVINSTSGKKFIGIDHPFLLILDKGENIHQAIAKFAADAKLNGASLSGLGAFKDPNVAYYNLETKEYECKVFPGIFELISLNGNVAFTEENELAVHLHVTIGDQHHQVTGGHLIDATIGITGEITVVPFKDKVYRKMNCEVGLKLIDNKN